MDISIPEAILLLAIDDETGKPVVSDSAVGMAFAAGAAAQLVLQGRIRISGVDATDAKPGTFVSGDGQADERLEPLVEHLVGRTPEDALGKIVGFNGPGAPAGKLRAQTLEDFDAAGLLARRDQKLLGITFGRRWERGARIEVEDALQARARKILQGVGATGDASPEAVQRDAVLAAALAILHTVEALPKVFPELPEEQVVAAGQALAADDWASETVRDSLQALEGAMVAIMVTTVIVPTIVTS
ncbi:GPP34 family phosphoprotein [Agrococcus sp. Ld7]|uniref:GPP34 family phosphoprotein n=1 Tax=Agrococcus sp. Ld7 TaxID=649148 RepID=UPI003863287B